MYEIFVDAGGGDKRSEVIAGAITASHDLVDQAHLTLVGPERLIRRVAAHQSLSLDHVTIHHCDLIVPMDVAVDQNVVKQPNTVAVAAKLAKEHSGGLLSCGNTGALYWVSNLLIKRIEGVRRPGLAAHLPTRTGQPAILVDAGGMVDCHPEDLATLGLIGTAYYQAIRPLTHPVVGLLSNGTETWKGNGVTKAAFGLLSELDQAGKIEFAGNIEGTDLFRGKVQVIVADGFAGNIALKSAEAGATEVSWLLRNAITNGGALTKICAALLRPIFRSVRDRMDDREHNGATMLGCTLPVVKGHGKSDRVAAKNAVMALYRLMENDPVAHIKMLLAK